MFTIEIENKRESVLYSIALGCVLLLIISVTWIYWSHQSHLEQGAVEFGTSGVVSISTGEQAVGAEEPATSVKTYHNKANENSSLRFFGILIVSLLLLFGLTFRYYSHREVREAEKRWRITCEHFLTRMEIERMASEEEKLNNGNVWSKILNGNKKRKDKEVDVSVKGKEFCIVQ